METAARFIPRLLAVMAPVLFLLLIPTIRNGRGPAPAAASPGTQNVQVAPEAASFAMPPLTTEQTAATQYLAEHPESRDAGMPFLRPERMSDTPAQPVTDTVLEDDRPLVNLTSIMTGSRPIAVVNGKPMTVGQALAGDWVLVSIDAQGGLVRFEHRFDSERFFTAKLLRDLLPGG